MPSFAESGKTFTVLRFGPIRFAEKSWDSFFDKYQNIKLVESPCKNRAEFFHELESGLYKDVNYISRTYQSYEFTGLFDRELLENVVKYTKVKAISHTGAGYDQVDAIACRDLGLQLSNVPGAVDDSTADTNVFLILACMRNFQLGHENLMKGKWPEDNKSAGTPYGHSLQGKTVGILGMGGIGRTIRDRLQGFGFKKIIYYNRTRLDPDLELGAEYCPTLDELVMESDIISVNIPLNPHTRHIINKDLIAKMKDNVVIVNTARGPVIDEAALKPALLSGKVFSFGTDVFENEPNIDFELAKLPNVVSLPHMGTHTMETLLQMEEIVISNVETFYKTGKVLTPVAELKGLY